MLREGRALEPVLDRFDLNNCSSKVLLERLDANRDSKISKDELAKAIREVQMLTPRKRPSKKAIV